MSKFLKSLIFIVSLVLFIIYSKFSCAQPVSSADLINRAGQYDFKSVVFEGEVIGDIMRRGDYAWVNVFDGENALGIWTRSDLAGEIKYTGGYKSKGDGIEVTGIFHRACPEHGGDLDIHAQGLRRVAQGRNTQEKINPAKIAQALVLLGVVVLIWILTLLKRK
jgi:hypothetical protein